METLAINQSNKDTGEGFSEGVPEGRQYCQGKGPGWHLCYPDESFP